jgi:hypothetical protein
MRTLIAIFIVALMASSTAFARKASHHHSKRAAPKHQLTTKTDPGGVPRHPEDRSGRRPTPSGRRRARSEDREHMSRLLNDR